MKYIKGLDTLRAFAVFFVIIGHFGFWFDTTTPSGKFISLVAIPDGRFGVDLFFVLSGFLITSILLKAKDDGTDANRFSIIKNFFARRALRIFPIYYLLLFFLFIINYPDVRQYFWYYATYTSNLLPYHTNTWNRYCHTWTPSVEEQFYLLWPWLIIFVNNRNLKYIFLAAVLTGVLSTYISVSVQGHMEPFLVFNNFDAFGLGGLYAWCMRNDKHNRLFIKTLKIFVIIPIAMCFYWRMGVMNNTALPFYFLVKTCNSIVALWLIVLVVNNKSARVGKYILGNKVVNYIGKISYGIYLYHFVYIGYFFAFINKFLYAITLSYPALNRVIHDQHTDYWIEVFIMILIAAISYELIEKPILSLKKRFKYST